MLRIIHSSLVLAATLPFAVSAEPQLPAELPLGRIGLPETREVTEIAPGLTRIRIERGADTGEGWLLEAGPFTDRAKAKEMAATFAGAFVERGAENTDAGTPIYFVRSYGYADKPEAEAMAETFKAATGGGAVRSLADTGALDIDGPWIINLLIADLATYPGKVDLRLAKGAAPEGQPVLEIAKHDDAAVNGSFFVFHDDWGSTTGRPAGLFMERGKVVSEPINGRPAMVVSPAGIDMLTNVRGDITVTVGDQTFPADGLNRKPGRVVNCGNIGDLQGENAAHDFFCDDADELIVFTPYYGATSDTGAGVELVIENGIITDVRSGRGGAIPPDGFTIQATGDIAEQLKDISTQSPSSYHVTLQSDSGELVWDQDTEILNGGPTLLWDGAMPATSQRAIEGWSHNFEGEDRLGFYYGWVLRRHPRTAAGVSQDGKTLYLATVDGRQPGVSVGATISEMAGLMKSLGADDAINLDGGGSTTMVVSGQPANSPSDPTPRPVADAVVLTRE